MNALLGHVGAAASFTHAVEFVFEHIDEVGDFDAATQCRQRRIDIEVWTSPGAFERPRALAIFRGARGDLAY